MGTCILAGHIQGVFASLESHCMVPIVKRTRRRAVAATAKARLPVRALFVFLQGRRPVAPLFFVAHTQRCARTLRMCLFLES